MATVITMMIVGVVAIAATQWIVYVNHYKIHDTDLMAGDEGED